MPRFGSFTSAKSLTTSSRSKVPFIYSPINWFRGTTKYISGYSLGTFSTVQDALSTEVTKFGNKSLYIPYVNNSTRYFIEMPIDSIGDQWIIDMWIYLPTTNYGASDHTLALFSLIDSTTGYIAGQYLSPGSGNTWLLSTVTLDANPGSASASQGSNFTGNRKDQWKHVVIARESGGATCFWVDGQPGSWAYGGTHRWVTSYNTFRIGCLNDQTTDALKRGYLDHIHMTSGLNRFGITAFSTPSLSIPTSKPTPISNTIFLINF